MTRELFWLTLTVILTGLLWVPYILNRCQVRGLGGAMANPSRDDKPHAEWATRLMFAHDNAVENLVDLRAAGADPQRDRLFDQMDRAGLRGVFLGPRRASDRLHLGLPVFRTLAFTVGFLAQAVLALAIFKIV